MSIYDNVAAGLNFNAGKVSKSEKDDLVERSLRGAHLWDEVKDRLDRPGSGLSGGQQQRLCIARALAANPEVLLRDEPCSALDPRSTKVIEDLVVKLREDVAVVIVTHNLQQAYRIADYVGFMYLGELVEYGSAHTMFGSPREQRTQEYVSGAFG
jgi:phosphate transport system ATP-binding protein